MGRYRRCSPARPAARRSPPPPPPPRVPPPHPPHRQPSPPPSRPARRSLLPSRARRRGLHPPPAPPRPPRPAGARWHGRCPLPRLSPARPVPLDRRDRQVVATCWGVSRVIG